MESVGAGKGAAPALARHMSFETRFLKLLRDPATGSPLRATGIALIAEHGSAEYSLTPEGIPLFAEQAPTEDARRQQLHYDRVARQYLENLGYPHTQEYMKYLDGALERAAAGLRFGDVAEICCGGAEGIALFKQRIDTGIGVDISAAMLASARKSHPEDRFLFVQGDATCLPLASEAFDTAVMLGGIHHVNDRQGLFSEIARILKPGGRFLFREPVSDFWLWKWLRAVIYKFSPALDSETERPLLQSETVAPLEAAGLRLLDWKTFGFFGYCALMNSDVLVVNRLFRYVPGIRPITRFACVADEWILRLPAMSRMGLIVIGVAEKPRS
jgi:ubiquinone/menaquinone biosynthesis C-methylase UbiE